MKRQFWILWDTVLTRRGGSVVGLKGDKEQMNPQVQACPSPPCGPSARPGWGQHKVAYRSHWVFLRRFVWLCQSQPSLVHSPSMWTGERDSPQVEHFQAATECVKRKTQKGRERKRDISPQRWEESDSLWAMQTCSMCLCLGSSSVKLG